MRGPKLLQSRVARALRGTAATIGLISSYAADVLDVGVDLVAQPEIQRQVGADAPVVLDEQRDVVVVGVRQDQRLVGLAAAQRHREQQVVVVHLAVAVVIEGREVLDQLDAAVAEDAEVERARRRAATRRRRAGCARRGRASTRVGQLEALLRRCPAARGTTMPSWMLGNVSCGPAATGAIVLSNVLNDSVAAFDERRPT